MWIEFLVTSCVVVIAPGTGVIYTIGIGLARGRGASVVAAAGCTMGIVPHMAAAIFGLAALLHTSPTAFQAFKVAGVLYLLYMAWSILNEDGALDVRPSEEGKPLRQVAITGTLINILNPKLSVFFLAFLPQFVPADTAMPLTRMILLSVIFMALTFVVFVGYGACAAGIRHHIITRPVILTWMRRLFAAAFVLLALRLMQTGL